jgi:hypothetical protein
MTNKTPFPTANYKDHFIYDNLPFINPEHGELDPVQWATVIDTSLIEPDDFDPDDYYTRPSYYLQITPGGEVRGVTRDYDEHEEYFSVAANDSDVVFLKLFLEQYPHLTPTLTSLLYFRKDQASKWMEQVDQEKENILNDD